MEINFYSNVTVIFSLNYIANIFRHNFFKMNGGQLTLIQPYWICLGGNQSISQMMCVHANFEKNWIHLIQSQTAKKMKVYKLFQCIHFFIIFFRLTLYQMDSKISKLYMCTYHFNKLDLSFEINSIIFFELYSSCFLDEHNTY